ncbi:hypothetical protein ACDN41_12685 [Priestia aryabhattai]|uniref:hypothetical protein n=1 Tax=Priestia aryabhattai TaxID=412384 RepID=UPI003531FAB7
MTPYESIYDRFLSKITDYELKDLIVDSLEDAKNQLLKYLRSAIVDFYNCNNDLSLRDDTTESFETRLSDIEQEILANYMVTHWMKPQVLRLENIRKGLGSKDFTVFSGANHLKQLQELKTQLENDASKLNLIYYYQA